MAISFKKVSVLVAEDNPAISSMYRKMLEELEFGKITMTSDGDRAFEAFCELKPDLILSDWEMEPTTGMELLRKVRNSDVSPDPMVPFIFITGYAADSKIEEAARNGMTAFIVKPFTVDKLAEKLEDIINNPSKFIISDEFRGPDRRVNNSDEYSGEERRGK